MKYKVGDIIGIYYDADHCSIYYINATINNKLYDGVCLDGATMLNPCSDMYIGLMNSWSCSDLDTSTQVELLYNANDQVDSNGLVLPISKHTCKCLTFDLVNFGCKCGGV